MKQNRMILISTLAVLVAIGGLFIFSQHVSSQQMPGEEKVVQDAKSEFVHVVYFWIKEGTPEGRVQGLIDDCKNYLGAVETVKKLYVGVPAGTDREVVDNSWGVNLIMYFDNKEDHDYYQKAEKHLQFIERNQDMWERVQVYDTITK